MWLVAVEAGNYSSLAALRPFPALPEDLPRLLQALTQLGTVAAGVPKE